MRLTRLVWALALTGALTGCKSDEPAETKTPSTPPRADTAVQGSRVPPAEIETAVEPVPPGSDEKAVRQGEAKPEASEKDAGSEAPPAKDASGADAAATGGTLQSDDILAREPATESAKVLHVLVGWRELAPAYRGQMDERAAARDRAAADALAREVLEKAKAGEDFAALMKTHSEDPGSASTARPYTATPDAPLVPPFKKLALRLGVGEVGLVETAYGWHVIKRIE
jgi:parvulin-like peptidyl-prolyl isomerase